MSEQLPETILRLLAIYKKYPGLIASLTEYAILRAAALDKIQNNVANDTSPTGIGAPLAKKHFPKKPKPHLVERDNIIIQLALENKTNDQIIQELQDRGFSSCTKPTINSLIAKYNKSHPDNKIHRHNNIPTVTSRARELAIGHTFITTEMKATLQQEFPNADPKLIYYALHMAGLTINKQDIIDNVIKLVKMGLSNHEIANKLGIGRNTVSRWFKTYYDENPDEPRPLRGQHRNTGPRPNSRTTQIRRVITDMGPENHEIMNTLCKMFPTMNRQSLRKQVGIVEKRMGIDVAKQNRAPKTKINHAVAIVPNNNHTIAPKTKIASTNSTPKQSTPVAPSDNILTDEQINEIRKIVNHEFNKDESDEYGWVVRDFLLNEYPIPGSSRIIIKLVGEKFSHVTLDLTQGGTGKTTNIKNVERQIAEELKKPVAQENKELDETPNAPAPAAIHTSIQSDYEIVPVTNNAGVLKIADKTIATNCKQIEFLCDGMVLKYLLYDKTRKLLYPDMTPVTTRNISRAETAHGNALRIHFSMQQIKTVTSEIIKKHAGNRRFRTM